MTDEVTTEIAPRTSQATDSSRELADQQEKTQAALAELARREQEQLQREREEADRLGVELRLDAIRLDGDTQPRAGIDLATVDEYAEATERGVELPPAEVVHDGKDYWLWDGFHRYHGRKKAGKDTMRCRARTGTVEEARWLSLSANQGHGLKRTRADTQRAIELALQAQPDLSSRAIGDHVGVHHETVEAARRRLAESASREPGPAPAAPVASQDSPALAESASGTEVRTDRNGRQVNVSKIGKPKGKADVKSNPDRAAPPTSAPTPPLAVEPVQADEPKAPATPPSPTPPAATPPVETAPPPATPPVETAPPPVTVGTLAQLKEVWAQIAPMQRHEFFAWTIKQLGPAGPRRKNGPQTSGFVKLDTKTTTALGKLRVSDSKVACSAILKLRREEDRDELVRRIVALEFADGNAVAAAAKEILAKAQQR